MCVIIGGMNSNYNMQRRPSGQERRTYMTGADIQAKKAAMRRRKKRQQRQKLILLGLAVVFVIVIIAIIVLVKFFSNVKSSVTIEVGDPLPAVEDLMDSPSSSIECLTDLATVDQETPGDYGVVFKWGIFKKTCTIKVRDTVPPVVTVKDVVCPKGESVGPADFIEKVEDRTPVAVSFVTAPDCSVTGTQDVQLLVEDQGGNQVNVTAKLEVCDDFEPPVISGTKDITVYVGESATYRKDVTVTDDKDPNPVLKIDSSAVNLDVPGEYTVTYTATDAVGNTSSVDIKVSVQDRPENYDDIVKLNQKADDLLENLGVNSMEDDLTKLFTIFRWVRKNIPWYGGRVTSHDKVVQALKGLAGNSGDCFTDAAACEILLQRAGFETKFMERKNNLGLHYWVMVKVGDNWYHMDPAPIYLRQFVCFLGTDKQLKWFSTDMRPGYYDHDYSKYPATPEEPYATVKYDNGEYYLENGN